MLNNHILLYMLPTPCAPPFLCFMYFPSTVQQNPYSGLRLETGAAEDNHYTFCDNLTCFIRHDRL